jgi:subtilisin family serine protease
MLNFRRMLLSTALLTCIGAAHAQAQTTGGSPCLPTDAACRPPESGAASAKIDAKFHFLKQIIDTEGRTSPVFGPRGAPAGLSRTHVGATLRFVDELPDHVVADFETRGIRFVREDNELVHVGAVYVARVDWTAFEFLAKHPLLVRAESIWRPVTAAPMAVTSELVGASYAHRMPDMSFDGEGVTVADIDSGFDVLHPHLFRADGGYYDWEDANRNGRFDLNEDTLDHDGDGVSEKLRLIDGVRLQMRAYENRDGMLQPRYDWVYLDLNGDDRRNAGPAHGFSESDPAYGEPIFVVDDVDEDGVLEVGEKLVRLETSKFRKVTLGGEEYVRGTNLIEAAAASVNLRPGHGTGVASILAGGQQGFHEHIGLAPGVDILGYESSNRNSQADPTQGRYDTPLSAIADAVDEGAALVLHEWTNIVGIAADGSSNLEYAMDQARARGVLQITPLGNLNLSGKHASRPVEAGGSVELKFNVGEGFPYGQQIRPFAVVYISLFWRNSDAPTIKLVSPDGSEITVVLDRQLRTLGQASLYGSYQTTFRGTRQAAIMLWRADRTSLAMGDWTIRMQGFSHSDEVTARVSDSYSGWSKGVAWLNPTRDHGTMVFPSSADSAFGVAAFGGRHSMSFGGESSEPGELRGYSGRGPRIDGARGVDIAAPDDPYAAFGITSEYVQQGYQRGWFRVFGGTSGAGPHVAASVALIKQQHPDWTPEQIESRLQQTARNTALLPDYGAYPNTHWGYGKLDVYNALYGIARPEPDNQAPVAALEAALRPTSVVFDASASADPDGDAVEYRFDFDYDGRWDTEWLAEPSATAELSVYDEEKSSARVAVRDSSGLRSGALVALDLTEIPEPAGDVGNSERDAGSGDAGQTADDAGSDAASHDAAMPDAAGSDVAQQPIQPGSDGGFRCDTGASGPGSALGFVLALFGSRLLGFRRSVLGRAWRRRSARI